VSAVAGEFVLAGGFLFSTLHKGKRTELHDRVGFRAIFWSSVASSDAQF
jgi:hypothetical protein